MNQAATELTGEEVTVDNCEWEAHPEWRGKLKDPNWFSSVKGADGFQVICYAHTSSSSEPEVAFKWDWSADNGISSFSWDYSHRDDQPLNQ